jgi:hypothetical protein
MNDKNRTNNSIHLCQSSLAAKYGSKRVDGCNEIATKQVTPIKSDTATAVDTTRATNWTVPNRRGRNETRRGDGKVPLIQGK